MWYDHLIEESWEAYNAARKTHMTSHSLNDFRKCPLLFKQKRDGIIVQEDTTSMIVGRATHAYILEGESVYLSQFAIGGPINHKTGKTYGEDTKAFSEWVAEQGKPCISEKTDALIRAMGESVRDHAVARRILSAGKPELVARRDVNNVPCQGRFDWCFESGFVDLKTCENLDYFEHDARRFGYLHQAGFYANLIHPSLGLDAYLIAVEKAKPHRVGVWIVNGVMDRAITENLAALKRYKVCNTLNQWPTGYEDVRSFEYL